MAENTDLGLSDSEAAHQAVMRSIAEKMIDTPYVLKGGTALLFTRGLDRHSTDLDFDSYKSLNLESRIRNSFEEEGLELKSLNLYKDSDTTQRYKIHYENPINGQDEFLKIESKVNKDIDPATLEIVEGIKTYNVNTAFDQKLDAVEGRASVRDLYDVRHMLNNYGDELSDENALRAAYLFADEAAVYSSYEQDHSEDPILSNESLEKMVMDTKYAALEVSNKRDNGIELSTADREAIAALNRRENTQQEEINIMTNENNHGDKKDVEQFLLNAKARLESNAANIMIKDAVFDENLMDVTKGGQNMNMDIVIDKALHTGTDKLNADEFKVLDEGRDKLPPEVQEGIAFRMKLDEQLAARDQFVRLEASMGQGASNGELERRTNNAAIAANALVSVMAEMENASPDRFIEGLPESVREDYELISTPPPSLENAEKKTSTITDFLDADNPPETGPIKTESMSFPDLKIGQILNAKDQNDVQLYLLDTKARLDAMGQSGDKRAASDAFTRIKDAAFPLLNEKQQKVWEPPAADRDGGRDREDDDYSL